MSGWEGVLLTIITLGSCWASYACGQRNMFLRMRDQQEKRRRWREWEDFED
jgi:polyferredoxin